MQHNSFPEWLLVDAIEPLLIATRRASLDANLKASTGLLRRKKRERKDPVILYHYIFFSYIFSMIVCERSEISTSNQLYLSLMTFVFGATSNDISPPFSHLEIIK